MLNGHPGTPSSDRGPLFRGRHAVVSRSRQRLKRKPLLTVAALIEAVLLIQAVLDRKTKRLRKINPDMPRVVGVLEPQAI